MSHPATPTAQQKTAVKVMYSTKVKRKRNIAEDAESGEESDLRESDTSVERRSPKSPQVASKTPEPKSGPKVVDVHLPGPSPKRPARDLEESSPKPASKAKRTIRPSASSPRQPSPSRKPPSAAKPSSTRQPEDPEDDADETSSIADSVSGARIRRSEPERIQYFKNQSDCGELEPNRAFCTRCQSWVNLGKRRTYTVRPWEMHRAKCDLKPVVVKEIEPVADEPSQLENEKAMVAIVDEEKQEVASPPASVKSNRDASSPTSSKIRRSESERYAILQADPRAQEVKPHEVFCRPCQQWIKLSTSLPYVLNKWERHQLSCSGTAHSSRVATAERKIVLLNDPQAKACSPKSVECAFCKSAVALEGVVDYDLTRWNEHKANCTSTIVQMTPRVPAARVSRIFPPPASGSMTSQTPSITTRTPASSGSISTEVTAVADSPPAKTGVKRGREEDEEETPDNDRPSNRPRVEGYKPPEGEAPGPWGWFMQPLRAFIRGFREGLGTPSAT
ncbi:hypothetical protein F5I97DRAFT_1839379 [Phlebopus sp. FC_14]|nr:hypothetical protein F5I97DRAFT_1839379 [Phlebopus sp. FC_14]